MSNRLLKQIRDAKKEERYNLVINAAIAEGIEITPEVKHTVKELLARIEYQEQIEKENLLEIMNCKKVFDSSYLYSDNASFIIEPTK